MLIALIALALNLRSPLTAISPVIADIRADLGIGPAMAGLLTSIPVLCFGVLTPVASVLIARVGIEASIFVTLGGLALGTVIRSAGGLFLVLAGTVVIGAALTVGNIVCLMIIARDFPRRLNSVTGFYTSALNVGTMLTSALTAPLAGLFGWRAAIGFWVVLALVATLLWWRALRRRNDALIAAPATAVTSLPPSRPVKTTALPVRSTTSVWRSSLVWLLVLAFSTHLLLYYGLTAWLPAYLTQADGLDATTAGFAASAFQILSLLGSFGVPVLATTWRIPRAWILIGVAAAWFVTSLGLLMAPGHWFLWSITGGVACGGGFTAIFTLVMARARDLDENRRISSAVQGLGYALAAVGPLAIGSLHQASGTWTSSFFLLCFAAVLMTSSGIGLLRSRRPGDVD
ncbi:MFS transporter [Telmatospirillum sp.]|uniref:MFS transporter n=1 Tax=Telmatospirillum sp. TaxID=2079197 RepID=UPI00283C3960|nr:MFS transporter [Telmatospirillum sp.]MDR3438339.1 MFS transporter [Telmatospirillum sp.]